MTFHFLSCDAHSDCGAKPREEWCTFQSEDTLVPGGVFLFLCDNEKVTVPYTMVCDFREDCGDGSDERFCSYGPRQNAGIVPLKRWPTVTTDPIPSFINLGGGSGYTQVKLNNAGSCPETHFRCLEGLEFCLPVYVLCNGVFDCPGHEDEASCEEFTCPGFYRCRNSTVCLHPSHFCDDVSQCPQRDDELLCDVTCPIECRCQGLAFVCRQTFPVNLFPSLRYLDAARSSMRPGRMTENRYLVWFSLASCRLESLPVVELPNLQVLDLSHNRLLSLHTDIMSSLSNLRVLRLAGNPLVSFDSGQLYNVQEN